MYVRFKPCMTNCVLCVLSRQELNTSLHCTMTHSTCPAGTFLVPCAMTQSTCLAERIVSWSNLGSHLPSFHLDTMRIQNCLWSSHTRLWHVETYTTQSKVFSPVSVMWRYTQLSPRPSHIRLSARSQSSVKQYRTSSDLHFTCVFAYNNKLRVPLHRSVCSRPQTTHGKQ